MSGGEFAGTLRERIVIEQLVSTRNGMGLQETAWEAVCSCSASIKLETFGRESEGQALTALPRYRVTIRRMGGLALDQRVSWNGRKFIVRQLIDDPQSHDRIAMRCEEVRA